MKFHLGVWIALLAVCPVSIKLVGFAFETRTVGLPYDLPPGRSQPVATDVIEYLMIGHTLISLIALVAVWQQARSEPARLGGFAGIILWFGLTYLFYAFSSAATQGLYL